MRLPNPMTPIRPVPADITTSIITMTRPAAAGMNTTITTTTRPAAAGMNTTITTTTRPAAAGMNTTITTTAKPAAADTPDEHGAGCSCGVDHSALSPRRQVVEDVRFARCAHYQLFKSRRSDRALSCFTGSIRPGLPSFCVAFPFFKARMARPAR